MLSYFQNFLSKVIYVTLYYERWLQAMQVNDVNVMVFYGGKLVETLFNFNKIDLGEVDNPDAEWNNGYKVYVPPNQLKYEGYSPPNPYELYGGIILNPTF